jgi:hypothetical protein
MDTQGAILATKIPCVGWESGKKWPDIGLQKFPWCWNIGAVLGVTY